MLAPCSTLSDDGNGSISHRPSKASRQSVSESMLRDAAMRRKQKELDARDKMVCTPTALCPRC